MLRVFFFALSAFSETFDVYTFDPPAGYTRRQHKDAVEFSKIDQQRKFYCQFGFYRAQKSAGDAAQDAAAEWKAVVLNSFKQRGEPVSKPLPLPDAPDSVVVGAETTDGNGNKAISSLFVIRRNDRYVGIAFNVPNAAAMEACQSDAGAIISSFRFTGPVQAPTSAATAPPTGAGKGIIGIWERVTASQPAGRYNMITKQWQYDPVAALNQFRHTWRYRFEDSGVYSFELDGEDFNRQERTLTVERGSYTQSGAVVKFTPRECQAGKSPRTQTPALKTCALPAARETRFSIGEHPQYKDSAGLQILEKDGSWVTYKPVR